MSVSLDLLRPLGNPGRLQLVEKKEEIGENHCQGGEECHHLLLQKKRSFPRSQLRRVQRRRKRQIESPPLRWNAEIRVTIASHLSLKGHRATIEEAGLVKAVPLAESSEAITEVRNEEKGRDEDLHIAEEDGNIKG